MMVISQGELLFRLLLSLLVGGLIGLERESHNRPAGFRTHILVCLGSTLIMVLSIYGFVTFDATARDPARLAAQVVSGIGFLGAGTILREGLTIKGLTTAASLWVIAAIGLALGAGFYLGGLFTAGLVILTLVFLDEVEKRYLSGKHVTLSLRGEDRPGQLGQIATALGSLGVNIRNIELKGMPEHREIALTLRLELPARLGRAEVMAAVSDLPGIREASLE